MISDFGGRRFFGSREDAKTRRFGLWEPLEATPGGGNGIWEVIY